MTNTTFATPFPVEYEIDEQLHTAFSVSPRVSEAFDIQLQLGELHKASSQEELELRMIQSMHYNMGYILVHQIWFTCVVFAAIFFMHKKNIEPLIVEGEPLIKEEERLAQATHSGNV